MGGGRRHLHVVTDLSAVVVDGVEVVLEFAESKVSESEEAVFSFRKQITEEEELRARSFDLLCCTFCCVFVVLIVVFYVVARMHV